MEGSQIALTTRFKYLLLKIKKYSLFEKLMKENILSLVFFRSKKYLDLSKISSFLLSKMASLPLSWTQESCQRMAASSPQTLLEHLTRQLPGHKDCLGLQTAGDGGVCFRL